MCHNQFSNIIEENEDILLEVELEEKIINDYKKLNEKVDQIISKIKGRRKGKKQEK